MPRCHVLLAGVHDEIAKLSCDLSEARLDAHENETIGAIADAQELLEQARAIVQEARDGERRAASKLRVVR